MLIYTLTIRVFLLGAVVVFGISYHSELATLLEASCRNFGFGESWWFGCEFRWFRTGFLCGFSSVDICVSLKLVFGDFGLLWALDSMSPVVFPILADKR